MQIVLKVRDDGTAVIEKFGQTAEKTGEDISINWGKVGTAIDLAAATAVTTAAVMVKSAIDTADATSKTADKLGMTTEALSGLQYVASLADVSSEELALSLKMMARNLSDAAQGTGAAKYAIQDLGLSAQQLARMKPEQAIEAISAALEKIPNQGDRVRIAMDIFGRSGDQMVNVLRGGPEVIRATIAEAQRMGKIISTETGEAAKEFGDNVKRLKGNLEGLANSVATIVVPALLRMTDAMLGNNSLDALMRRRAELGQQYSQQMAAGLSKDSARAKWLLQQIDEVDARIIEANKKLAAQPPPVPKSAGGGAPTGLGSQQIEELLKKYQDVHDRMISEQQKLAETYVKDWQVFKQMLDNKRISQAQYQEDSKRLAESYEIDLAEIQKPNPTLFDQYVAQLTNQSIALAESLKSKEQLEQESYDARLQMLDEAEMRKIDLGASYDSLREEATRRHQANVTAIENAGLSQQYGAEHAWMERTAELMKGDWSFKLQGIALVLNKASQLMQSDRKKEFEFGKKAAIGEALISTFLGAAKALGTYGFPLGAVFAALTIAVGMMNVRRIQSQQFGGGSSAVPTFSASPNTGLPEAPTSQLPSDTLPQAPASTAAVSHRTVNITLVSQSGMLDVEWVRNTLIPGLNEAVGDGATLRVTQ